MTRDAIEAEIDRLIGILDLIDGDPDFEADTDTGADDEGERQGDTFLEAA